MPPATPRQGRARARPRPRCTFVEHGLRCRRFGGGTPPLCQGHWRVVQNAARPGAAAAEVIGDLFNGRRPNRGRVAEAAVDLLAALFRSQPTPRPLGPEDFRTFRPFERPFDPFQPQPRAAPRQPPPPPPTPPPPVCIGNTCPECKLARKVLGLKAATVLTPEIIKAQHRKLARKHHPDLGGKTEDMQRVNAAVEQLLEDLG